MLKHMLLLPVLLVLHTAAPAQGWIQKTSYPGSLPMWTYSKYFNISNSIFTLNESSRELWEYSTANDTWTQRQSFPGPARNFGAAMTISGKAYYGSGNVNGNWPYSSSFWEYDPVTDSWSSIDSLPAQFAHATGFSIGNKGYITMGNTNMSITSDQVWEYDPASGNWTQKNDAPFLPRYVCSVVSYGIHAMLGLGYSNPLNMWLDDLYSYDPTTDTWTTLPLFPYGGRCQTAAATDGNYAYWGLGNTAMTEHDDLFRLDLQTGNWTSFGVFPGGVREQAMAFIINHKLYVGMGSTQAAGAQADLWEYDLTSSVTENQPALPYYWYKSNTHTVTLQFGMSVPDRIEVFDVTGKICIALNDNTESRLDLPLPANGIYLVRCQLNGKPVSFKVTL